jgi:2-oxo-4-hydroxy-4-carboxy-5-ureidoimidazoline decarboxylase
MLERLNALPREQARDALLACCGSARWAERMLAARPFRDVEALYAEAERAWLALGREDWLEAFSKHPRIGERKLDAAWTRQEQKGVENAAAEVLAALEHGNREYEGRFGHVFLVCATGKSAAEMLALLEKRLKNDPESELRVAAGEQAKITRIRLEKWLKQQ